MDEDKWERYEREQLQIQPETMAQLELVMKAFVADSVDEVVRLLLQTRTFSLRSWEWGDVAAGLGLV